MPENTHIALGVESAENPALSGLPLTPASHGTQSGSPAKRQWRVLLVEDNAAIRPVWKVLHEEHADLEAIGEASDGEEAALLAGRYRADATPDGHSSPSCQRAAGIMENNEHTKS